MFLQLLLAVASGAYLMTPAWVTASLEAGHWLPEQTYLSNVRNNPRSKIHTHTLTHAVMNGYSMSSIHRPLDVYSFHTHTCPARSVEYGNISQILDLEVSLCPSL